MGSEGEHVVKSKLEAIQEAFGRYAPGWSWARVGQRIEQIRSFAIQSGFVIPFEKRQKISGLAGALLSELDGLSLDDEFLGVLKGLASLEGTWRKPGDANPMRGGDRRSGVHTLESSVLRMSVRLYCEAHAEPGFSSRGPLVRFVNAVGEASGLSSFTADAVKAEFRRIRSKAKRLPGFRAPSTRDPENQGGASSQP
jgi:hypothetical protein